MCDPARLHQVNPKAEDMSESETGTIFTATEDLPGEITVTIWERHAASDPGKVMRHKMELHDIERALTVLINAVMYHVRQMI